MSENDQVTVARLRDAVRTVLDYPKPGVRFYDITSLLDIPECFRYIVRAGCEWVQGAEVDKIVSIDARGFLYGAPIAYELGLPLALSRKNGKLPGEVYRKSFNTEYSEEIVEIQKCDIRQGERVVVVDDIIATGGTLKAVGELLTTHGAIVHSFAAIIGLDFCNYHKLLRAYRTHTILNFAK